MGRLRNTKKGKSSKFRGVCSIITKKDNSGVLWRASCDGEYIGTYPTEEDAARAYDDEAKLVFGSKAKLNFPK